MQYLSDFSAIIAAHHVEVYLVMNVVLWVVQGLLAVGFLGAGVPKASQSIDKLSKMIPWTKDVPEPLVRFIGVAEILGALGLILPLATNVGTWLVVAAAVGLALTMLLGVIFHVMRNEAARMAPTVVLLLLSAFVVVGRLGFAHF